MRSQLVADYVDQRVQTATAAAIMVCTPAAICADVRTPVGAAATFTATVDAVVGHPLMGSGSSAVDLGSDLTAGPERLLAHYDQAADEDEYVIDPIGIHPVEIIE